MDLCSCTDLLEMIRSGELPSSSNTALIREEITKMRQIVSKIRKILPIHEAAVAPVRRLPEDVLLRVFSYLEKQSSVDGGRVLVGRVCKFWRKVSRSSPTLWSSLYFFLPSPEASSPLSGRIPVASGTPSTRHREPSGDIRSTAERLPAKVAFLPQTLVLSKDVPLDIQMAFGGSRTQSTAASRHGLVQKVMPILSGQDYRIRTLELYLPRETPIPLFSAFNFQALETFTVHAARSVGVTLQDPDTVFPSTLRRLDLGSAVLPTSYRLQWSSLQCLQASFISSTMCYQTLSAAVNLEELVVPHIAWEQDIDDEAAPVSQPVITLPNLRILKLGTSSIDLFPRQIRLPTLANVYFGLAWTGILDPPSDLVQWQSIIQAWECNALTSWGYSGACPIYNFLPTFMGMGSSITKLDIHLFLVMLDSNDASGVEARWNGMKNFLDVLSKSTDDCLPLLAEMALRVKILDQDVYFSQGTAMSKVVRARKLRLTLEVTSHTDAGKRDVDMMKAITSPLSRAMWELDREGVVCEWNFDEEDVLVHSSELAASLE